MEKLGLVEFEQDRFQLYKQDEQIFMSLEELAKRVGFAHKENMETFLRNNSYLLEKEFSILMKVDNLENGVIKKREKRFFNEQGIYEVTLLANTKEAKTFRKFARKLITDFRKGNLVPKVPGDEYKRLDKKIDKMIETVEELGESIKLSEEAEQEYKDLAERLDKKLTKLEAIEKNVDSLIESYNKAAKIVNEHEHRIRDLEKVIDDITEDIDEK